MPEKTRKREVSARRAAAISATLCARSGGIFCAFVCYKKLYAARQIAPWYYVHETFSRHDVSRPAERRRLAPPSAQGREAFSALLCAIKSFTLLPQIAPWYYVHEIFSRHDA